MDKNNPTDQAKVLLGKYLRGECTPDEERKVQEWFYSFDEEEMIVEEERALALGNTKATIMDSLNNTKAIASSVSMFSWKGIAAAAAVCIVLGSVVGIYLQRTVTKASVELAAIISDSTGTYKNDIMPGASYAYVIDSKGVKKEIVNKEEVFDRAKQVTGSNELVTVGVPKAGKYKLELKDGTVVWLNSSSTLSFPEEFAKEERKVELDGEAYFEVAKDADRPFRISVKGATIEVLGTSFNVNAYTDEVNTSLVEGSVRIISDDIVKYLIPGEGAVIKDNDIKIGLTDLPKNTAWQRDEFYFDGSNLQDIIEQLARWYNVDFVNSEVLTGTSTYHGSISRNSKLSTALKVLALATQREFEIDGRKVIIE